MIQLTHPTEGVITLPEQLSWADEFTWQRVVQSTEYTTTGALVIDTWTKQSGRPITLAGSETRAWCERGTLITLRSWAEQPGIQYTLTGLRGVSRTVIFDQSSAPINADPILDYVDPSDSDPYAVTLKLIEL